MQERRSFLDLDLAEPRRHRHNVVLDHEAPQLGDAVAIIGNQRGAARGETAAAFWAERPVLLRRQRGEPGFLGPAVRELQVCYFLQIIRRVRQ